MSNFKDLLTGINQTIENLSKNQELKSFVENISNLRNSPTIQAAIENSQKVSIQLNEKINSITPEDRARILEVLEQFKTNK